METQYLQKWTLKKIMCYITYYFFAKNLPAYGEFGLLGMLSARLRRNLSRPLFLGCAKRIGIGKGTEFGNGATIVMKNYSSLGDYARVLGTRGRLILCEHVFMGPHCTFILQNHRYLDDRYEGFEGGDIIIDEHAWLGYGIIVLPGVRIGKHAIVGAGSVVTKDIPDFALAAGNPAVIKKYRKIK